MSVQFQVKIQGKPQESDLEPAASDKGFLDEKMQQMMTKLSAAGLSSLQDGTASMSSSFSKSYSYSSSSSFSSSSSKVIKKSSSSSSTSSSETECVGSTTSSTYSSESKDEKESTVSIMHGNAPPSVVTSSSKDIAVESKVSHTSADGDTHTRGQKYEFSEISVPVGDGSEPNMVKKSESSVSYEYDPLGGGHNRGKVTLVIPMKK